MNAKKKPNHFFRRLRHIPYFVFLLFLFAALIVNVTNISWLKPFALITFFFIPGYILLWSILLHSKYNFIEVLVLSFGLSLFLIIISTYILIRLNTLSSITLLLSLVVSILFTIKFLRTKSTDSFKFPQMSTFFKSSWQSISLKLSRESKYLIFIVFSTIIFFFVGFSLRQYYIFRMPDEYYYLWASNTKILTNLQYRVFPYLNLHLILSSTLKLGFMLTLSFYSELTGMTGIAPHVLTLVFYSMLLPVTYLIGSLHDKKTGTIAALFVASNPIIWFWNNRIMPDILYAVLASACFYFFYKSFNKRGVISWQYLVPALFFGILSYVIEPKLIFVFGIPFIIYILSGAKKHQILIQFVIVSVFISSLILGIILFAPWFFKYDFPRILSGLFSPSNFSLQDGVWHCWAYPYYYSHAVMLLALIGAFCFVSKHTKRESFLTLFSVGMCLYLHSTIYISQGARFSFIIFPIIMVLAAIGLTTKLGLYSICLVPLFYFLYPLLPASEPASGTFPQIADSLRILSRLMGIAIIIYKVLEGTLPNLQTLPWKRLQELNNLQVSKQVTVIMFLLIVSTSLSIGNSIVTNPQYAYSDYVNPNEVGLPQAGRWLTTNVPTNSTIITNARPQILSYYTNCIFDIESTDWKIDRQGVGTIITPNSQTEFSELLDAGKFDYLVVFTDPAVGEYWKRPYFRSYIEDDALFTIYEYVMEAPLEITGCELTDGWTVTRGRITFSLDFTDKKEGLYSIKVEGITNERGQTRISYNADGTWDLSKSTFDFWFKLDTATNPNYLSIILTDNAGNYRYWINSTQVFKNWDSDNWQNLQFFLNYCKGQEGKFNIEQVKRIDIYIYADPNTPITYHLDAIKVYTLVEKVYTLKREND